MDTTVYSEIDKTELEQLVNATSVESITKESAKIGTWVEPFSIDYVFTGDCEILWLETEVTAP